MQLTMLVTLHCCLHHNKTFLKKQKDLIAHEPVHLLVISAAEIGFCWDGGEHGGVRVSLLTLRILSGPTQHFKSAIFEAWQHKVR